jgi:hypothetical protein
MRKYWSQIAMLLLGVSLTVGFYEGRKLVKNTAKALTAATSITGSANGPHGRRGKDGDGDAADEDGAGSLAANDEDRPAGGLRRLPKADRLTPTLRGAAGDVRSQRLNTLRQRQRQRLAGRPGGPTGPAVPPPPVSDPADEQVDTGKAKEDPATAIPVSP